jgi:antitoxin (DNA-binding transcriptional repressor) of toxin-antitoxin stability system
MSKRRHARSVAATDAAKNFGALVNRVREESASYVIERGGTPVAEIRPIESRRTTVADLARFFEARSRALDERFGRAVADGVKALNRRQRPRDPWAS